MTVLLHTSDINVMLRWFITARAQLLPISGPLLQKKALLIAHEIGIPNFKASRGYLAMETEKDIQRYLTRQSAG